MHDVGDAPGVRERKKAKTRSKIQRCAFELFSRQGFDETTIEQIIAEAGVSSSTFFRYFPTKEDTIAYDNLDKIFIDAIRRQPASYTPVQAFQAALRATYTESNPATQVFARTRHQLMLMTPSLHGKLFDEYMQSSQSFLFVLAERMHRPIDDVEAQAVTAAILGVMTYTLFAELRSGRSDEHLDTDVLREAMLEKLHDIF